MTESEFCRRVRLKERIAKGRNRWKMLNRRGGSLRQRQNAREKIIRLVSELQQTKP